MTTEQNVLIVSTVADVATDHVVQRLRQLGVPHRRLNTEDFPFSATISFEVETAGHKRVAVGGESVAPPSAIWYRRIRTPTRPSGMEQGVYDFCLHETRAALLGSILSLNGRWMSAPHDVWRAEFKPLQLAVAAEVGLKIPPTFVTNDAQVVRRAFSTLKSMVVKPAMSGNVVYDGREHAIYTSRLLEEHLEYLDQAQLSPAIYQGLVEKRYDIRATIIGDRILAAAIDSQSDPDAAVDWRHTSNPSLPHHRIELPPDLCSTLLALMRRLNLNFGAVDLVQTPDGEFVFLEVNPNGQWLWLDDQLDLGVTDAIAAWLSTSVRSD